jgi:hypothetical protein
MRLASAFACEDLAAERQGRNTILDATEWRLVHRGLLAGCAGQVPIFRRVGAFTPPEWALGLLNLTVRLAESGWGPEEASMRARGQREPGAEEKRAAGFYSRALIHRKAAWLAAQPEAVEEANAWVRFNRAQTQPKPRPAGGLHVDGAVWLRMPAGTRQPAESLAVTQQRQRQAAAETTKVVRIRGRDGNSYTSHRDVLNILADNRRKASEFARNPPTFGCAHNHQPQGRKR